MPSGWGTLSLDGALDGPQLLFIFLQVLSNLLSHVWGWPDAPRSNETNAYAVLLNPQGHTQFQAGSLASGLLPWMVRYF